MCYLMASECLINKMIFLQNRMYWYTNKYPTIKELVMATIVSFQPESGFSVTLDEYDNIIGLLVISSVYRNRTRKNIQSICPVGSKHVLMVTHTESDRNYIDLSKKDVDEKDQKLMIQYYGKTKRLVNMAQRLSNLTSHSEQEWMDNVFTPNLNKGDMLNGIHLVDTLSLRENVEDLDLDEEYENDLLANHKKLFGTNIVKILQKIKLVAFGIDGCADISKKLHELIVTGSTDDEMYDNNNKYTVVIRPTAIPVYEIVVAAGTTTKAKRVVKTVVNTLLEFGKQKGFAAMCS